jgi:hypothetical protein
MRRELEALAESWDVPPKKHHSDYEQGFEDGQERCLQELRALIASTPESWAKELEALAHTRDEWVDLSAVLEADGRFPNTVRDIKTEIDYLDAVLTTEGSAEQGDTKAIRYYAEQAESGNMTAEAALGMIQSVLHARPIPAHDGLRSRILAEYDPIKTEAVLERSLSMSGAQQVNGQWYVPKWGCDQLEHVLDAALAEGERQEVKP